MSTSQNVSRRAFMQTTGAVAATATFAAKSYGKVVGANDRIRIGFIGAGGMASGHMRAIHSLRGEEQPRTGHRGRLLGNPGQARR